MTYAQPRLCVLSIVTFVLSTCYALAQFAPGPGSPFAAGSAPVAIATGDFNGDGLLDAVVANQNSNTVTVLLGNASGGFTPATASPFKVGTAPLSVAVADFNGDGHADLAVALSLIHI